MKTLGIAAAAVAFLSLAACGQSKEADAVEANAAMTAEAMENSADNMMESADNMTGNSADMMENKADNMMEKAENVVDAADAKADNMTDGNMAANSN